MRLSASKGVVRGSTVILQGGVSFPDGTEVLVTPLTAPPGSPAAVLAAMQQAPHLDSETVDEWERLMEEGKRRVSFGSKE